MKQKLAKENKDKNLEEKQEQDEKLKMEQSIKLRGQRGLKGRAKTQQAQKKAEMTPTEIRELLETTIQTMRNQNDREKVLQRQEFQMKMHDMITKTHEVTRKEKSKYIDMYKYNQERELMKTAVSRQNYS
jgi:hypothetical protein